ncbi:MAG: sugar transferase [Epsilonproteobacteria bacterium]|nr:sugar transferase [Campylobacterota bacterium]
MIIFGEKYNFIKLEYEKIKKIFTKIEYIQHKDSNLKEILCRIRDLIIKNKPELIVLNTKAAFSAEIIKYLKNSGLKGSKYTTIECFLEEYLYKYYIPEDNLDLSFLKNIKSYSKWQYFQKRVIDYFGVFWLIFFSWPIVLYSVYRIKKESPKGPILFKQKRVGFNGKEFECAKFRSMYTNLGYSNPYTQKDDPRIFPWGRIMRKTRIDELPQMINILKGEMHLIGPRAEWNELVQKYEKEIPCYNKRHLIAPGVTGWAQVNYPYGTNIEDAKQKLMYDLYYIKHWNIGLELKIVWMTAMTVVAKKGV